MQSNEAFRDDKKNGKDSKMIQKPNISKLLNYCIIYPKISGEMHLKLGSSYKSRLYAGRSLLTTSLRSTF